MDKQKQHEDFSDRPLFRVPSTLTLKEILLSISLVCTVIFAYGTMSTRMAVLEKIALNEKEHRVEQKKQTEKTFDEIKQMITDIKQDVRLTKHDGKELIHDLEKDINEIIQDHEQRIRNLEKHKI